jgi:translation initiation factor 2 alpha subunit (eIF-2alpha)
MAQPRTKEKSEGTKPTQNIKAISKEAKSLLATANKVDTQSLASLAEWLDSGADKLGSLVGNVKQVKKSILQSDAKAKVKADLYVVTTPLIKCKVKAADLRSAYSLHQKRLRNIVAMCNTLQGKRAKRAAKKKGGSK